MSKTKQKLETYKNVNKWLRFFKKWLQTINLRVDDLDERVTKLENKKDD
jgi:hypothetical protein